MYGLAIAVQQTSPKFSGLKQQWWILLHMASLPPGAYSASLQHGGWAPRKRGKLSILLRPDLLEHPHVITGQSKSQGQLGFRRRARNPTPGWEEWHLFRRTARILGSYVWRQPTTFCLKNSIQISRVAGLQCSHGFVTGTNLCGATPVLFPQLLSFNIYLSNEIVVEPKELSSENWQGPVLECFVWLQWCIRVWE